MLVMIMPRLITELVYEDNSWALRFPGEYPQPPVCDPMLLQQQLAEAGIQSLVIDMSRAPRVDSTGLKFLLSLYQACSGHVDHLILRNPNHHIGRILQIMQLNRLFMIEQDNSK